MTSALFDEKLVANEFDAWADTGRAESMANGHRYATESAVSSWVLTGNHQVLDVGCGNGWALRSQLERGAGGGLGIDLSPKMVARASAASHGKNCAFKVASAHQIPAEDATFSHILSVEALYYTTDPSLVLQEWARVAKKGAKLSIMIELFSENPAGVAWSNALDVPVHLLSEIQWADMVRAAGWSGVAIRRVVNPAPVKSESEFTKSRYWPSYEMYTGYRAVGSLVIEATR